MIFNRADIMLYKGIEHFPGFWALVNVYLLETPSCLGFMVNIYHVYVLWFLLLCACSVKPALSIDLM